MGFATEFVYAVILMGLPVPPGPGSLSSAVLKFIEILVMLPLKVMVRESWLMVLGQRKLPEKFCELMTPAMEDRLVVVCMENAGWVGVSAVELKWAVRALFVWSKGVGW